MKIEDQLMQLNERSEYARDVLGRAPSWLLRWGSSVILAAVMCSLWMGWILKYPDIIPAQITLTTERPPVRVVAPRGGKLAIIADTSTPVAINAPVALIENTVSWPSLQALKQWLDRVDDLDAAGIEDIAPPGELQLGELHRAYAGFMQHFETYQFLLSQQPARKRQVALETEQARIRQLLLRQQSQLDTLAAERQLVESSVVRAQTLLERGIISAEMYDTKQAELLRAVKEEQRQREQIAATEVQLSQLDKQRLGVRLDHDELRLKERLLAESAYQTLVSEIGAWEHNYLLRAPIAGRISWSAYWSDHQHVRQGDEVFAIVPDEAQAVFGKVLMPMQNSGKVKSGQQVYIKLDAFPYQEFGIIEGEVRQIALLPDNQAYQIEVDLPRQLRTSFKKTLPFRQEMLGRADIVTEDLRLLERIYYQLASAFKNRG